MKTLYIDCAAGISGSRLIGALLDLKRENAGEFSRRMSWFRQCGGAWDAGSDCCGGAPCFHVEAPSSGRGDALGFTKIKTLIAESELVPPVKKRVLVALNLLENAGCAFCGGENEALPCDARLAFEIVGALVLVDMLKIDAVYSSPVNVAGSMPEESGQSALPVPVSFFLKGMTVFAREGGRPQTTLSGALLLKALSASSAPLPAGKLLACGCGKDPPPYSSGALHVMLLEQNDTSPLPYLTGEIAVIETNIDDMNPQDYQNLEERLFACGALDVFFTPILMKKLRPAVRLTCISRAASREKLGEVILRYSTTIGLRWSMAGRMTLKRRIQKFESSFGPVSMKLSSWGNEIIRITAEYEDLKRISQETGCPLDQLRPLVINEFRQKEDMKNGFETTFDTPE